MKSRLAGAATGAVLAGLLLGVSPVVAPEASAVVTCVGTLTEASITPGERTVGKSVGVHWDEDYNPIFESRLSNIGTASISVDVPEGAIPGDQFSVHSSNGLTVPRVAAGEVFSPDGQVIATYEVPADESSMVFTYTDYVTKNKDVSFEFDLMVGYGFDDLESQASKTFDGTLTGCDQGQTATMQLHTPEWYYDHAVTRFSFLQRPVADMFTATIGTKTWDGLVDWSFTIDPGSSFKCDSSDLATAGGGWGFGYVTWDDSYTVMTDMTPMSVVSGAPRAGEYQITECSTHDLKVRLNLPEGTSGYSRLRTHSDGTFDWLDQEEPQLGWSWTETNSEGQSKTKRSWTRLGAWGGAGDGSQIPARPEPKVEIGEWIDEGAPQCDAGVVSQVREIVTTQYVLSPNWQWVLGESSREVESRTRALTDGELRDCTAMPDPVVTEGEWTDAGAPQCEAGIVPQVLEVTTTNHVWDELTASWVPGPQDVMVEDGERELTAEERRDCEAADDKPDGQDVPLVMVQGPDAAGGAGPSGPLAHTGASVGLLAFGASCLVGIGVVLARARRGEA